MGRIGALVLLLVLPASVLLGQDEYVLRIEFVEVRHAKEEPVEGPLRTMVVRPLEVTVAVGEPFAETRVVDGRKLSLRGRVEKVAAGELTVADYRFALQEESIELASQEGNSLRIGPRLDGVMSSIMSTVADGKQEVLLLHVLHVAWPRPADRRSAAKLRSALDAPRTEWVRKKLLEHREWDRLRLLGAAAEEQAAASLLRLARKHHAAGERGVAAELLAALVRQFRDTESFAAAKGLADEIAAAIREENALRPLVP